MLNFAMKPHLIYTENDAVKTKLGQLQVDQELDIYYRFVKMEADESGTNSGKVVEIDPSDWSAKLIASGTGSRIYNPIGIIPTNPRPTEIGGSDYAEMGDISQDDIIMVCVSGNMPIQSVASLAANVALITSATAQRGQLTSTANNNSKTLFNIKLTAANGSEAGTAPGYIGWGACISN